MLPRATLADVGLFYRRFGSMVRLVDQGIVEAEALVWQHGREGVEAARRLEEAVADAPLAERLYRWHVRATAERRQRLLEAVDPATRYEIVAQWARRRGSMIGSRGA